MKYACSACKFLHMSNCQFAVNHISADISVLAPIKLCFVVILTNCNNICLKDGDDLHFLLVVWLFGTTPI